MKYDIDDIVAALRRVGVEPNVQTHVVEELRAQTTEEKKDKEGSGTGGNQWNHVGLINGTQNGSEAAIGWVLKVHEDVDNATIVDRLCQAGQVFNTSRRGRRLPVTNLAEVLENVPRTITKTQFGIQVQTKESIYLYSVNGATPVDSRHYELP